MAGKLSAKQLVFVQEYLIDLNATAAAIRAGYSERTAAVQGSRLLRNVKVAAAIQEALADRAAGTQITAAKVLAELARIAFADMRSYADWGPDGVKLKDCSGLTDDQAAAVAEVSKSTSKGGRAIRFKLHDKVAALRDLGRHLKLFTDTVEHRGAVELEVIETIVRTREEAAAVLSRLSPAGGLPGRDGAN